MSAPRSVFIGCYRASLRLRAALIGVALFGGAIRSADAQEVGFYDETYLPQIQLVFATDDWLDQLVYNFSHDGGYVQADLYVDGVLVPAVGVQHKGDASYQGGARENMKITIDAFVPGQEFRDYDMITVDAGAQTNVFTEVAALWIMGDFQDVPLANLAHVDAGTAANPLDLGVFTNTERVDGRFIDRHFIGDGHRYWENFSVLPFGYLGEDVKDYHGSYEWQGGKGKTRFADIAAASIALEHSQNSTMRADLDPFLSVDACIRGIISNRLVGNFDGLEAGNNYYLCESVAHGSRILPVPWDLDFCFTTSHSNPVPTSSDGSNFPLKKIFGAKAEEERAHAFVRQYLDAGFAEGITSKRLRQLKKLALPWMLGSSYDPIDSDADANRAINRSITWITAIRDRLSVDPLYTRLRPRIVSVQCTPSNPIEGEDIAVTAQIDLSTVDPDEVIVWSRALGGFVATQMQDDGLHGDGALGDGVFGALLPAALAGDLVQYYVEVRPKDTATHHYAFFPEKTEFAPLEVRVRLGQRGSLRLNEILADNAAVDYDELGEADDWIELVNLSDADYELSGHFLSDDVQRRDRWRIPDGTWIPAHGRLRIWADGQEEQGPLHAGFRLAKSGGSVFLRAPKAVGSTLLDELDYGPQHEDRSFARVPDGGEQWFHLWRPTPLLPVLLPGEDNRYDLRPDGSPLDEKLKLDSNAEVGKELRLKFTGGAPNSVAFLLVSFAPASFDLGAAGPLLVNPVGWLVFPRTLDLFGEATWKADVGPELADLVFYAQVIDQGASNGLTVLIRS